MGTALMGDPDLNAYYYYYDSSSEAEGRTDRDGPPTEVADFVGREGR